MICSQFWIVFMRHLYVQGVTIYLAWVGGNVVIIELLKISQLDKMQ